MAPKRKSQETKQYSSTADSPVMERRRVTRSMAKAYDIGEVAQGPADLPPQKPNKRQKQAKQEVEKEKNEDSEVADDPEVSDPPMEGSGTSISKTIVIEHCKQCQSFKRRAEEAKSGLEKGLPAIPVIVNPEKPRRGCFEIRDQDGEKFISLLDMKRPFSKMKELDMGKVVSDIIRKIK